MTGRNETLKLRLNTSFYVGYGGGLTGSPPPEIRHSLNITNKMALTVFHACTSVHAAPGKQSRPAANSGDRDGRAAADPVLRSVFNGGYPPHPSRSFYFWVPIANKNYKTGGPEPDRSEYGKRGKNHRELRSIAGESDNEWTARVITGDGSGEKR